jgi:acetoin utilization deacetylase AcuC-like enzyme
MIGALNLPVLIVQEGGYKTRSLGLNARQFFAGLLETEPNAGESEKAPGKRPVAKAESGISKKSEKDQGKKNHVK